MTVDKYTNFLSEWESCWRLGDPPKTAKLIRCRDLLGICDQDRKRLSDAALRTEKDKNFRIYEHVSCSWRCVCWWGPPVSQRLFNWPMKIIFINSKIFIKSDQKSIVKCVPMYVGTYVCMYPSLIPFDLDTGNHITIWPDIFFPLK